MTELEKKELYTCTNQDFLKNLKAKNYDNPTFAFADAMKYIGKYNLDHEYTNCDINELIYLTKNEIAKMIVKEQKNNNSNVLDNDDRKYFKMFFKDPTGTIARYLEDNIKNIKDMDFETNYKMKFKDNVQRIASYLKTNAAQLAFNAFEERDAKVCNFKSTLETKLKESNKPIEAEFEKQKPRFFERMFNTTSLEYNNFKNTFNNYLDKNKQGYGNEAPVKTSAFAYLKHKFPNLKDEELPTLKQIENLSGVGRDRALFCVNVINSFKEKDELQNEAESLVNDVKNSNFTLPWEKETNKFQENLKNDVEDNEIYNNNDLENTPEVEVIIK